MLSLLSNVYQPAKHTVKLLEMRQCATGIETDKGIVEQSEKTDTDPCKHGHLLNHDKVREQKVC